MQGVMQLLWQDSVAMGGMMLGEALQMGPPSLQESRGLAV